MTYIDYATARERRDLLVAEVSKLEDLGKSFDLSAFPLPLRIGPRVHGGGICWDCPRSGAALHVYMKILPRGSDELASLQRDAQGMLELNTCTKVDQPFLDDEGPKKSIEQIRVAIKNMVLHEVYEALLFRGERIMDPHNYDLKPQDQPF